MLDGPQHQGDKRRVHREVRPVGCHGQPRHDHAAAAEPRLHENWRLIVEPREHDGAVHLPLVGRDVDGRMAKDLERVEDRSATAGIAAWGRLLRRPERREDWMGIVDRPETVAGGFVGGVADRLAQADGEPPARVGATGKLCQLLGAADVRPCQHQQACPRLDATAEPALAATVDARVGQHDHVGRLHLTLVEGVGPRHHHIEAAGDVGATGSVVRSPPRRGHRLTRAVERRAEEQARIIDRLDAGRRDDQHAEPRLDVEHEEQGVVLGEGVGGE